MTDHFASDESPLESLRENPLGGPCPPVVIAAYKRTDTLHRLLESLHQQTVIPRQVIVFLDAPNVDADHADVSACREFLESYRSTSRFELLVRARIVHVGCRGNALASMTEVLDQNDTAIFLDDDLYVAPLFYEIICKLLTRYRDDKQIFSVSGFSSPIYTAETRESIAGDFLVTNCFETWAWATWADRWRVISPALFAAVVPYERAVDLPLFEHLLGIPLVSIWYEHCKGRIGTKRWSYLVIYNCLYRKYLFICPKVSLAQNFGTGDSRATNDLKFNPKVNQFFHNNEEPHRLPRSLSLISRLSIPCTDKVRIEYLLKRFAPMALRSECIHHLGAASGESFYKQLRIIIEDKKPSLLSAGLAEAVQNFTQSVVYDDYRSWH